MNSKDYVPALSFRWLTPFYDTLVEGPMLALQLRQSILSALGEVAGKSVLDVGCGTGALAILIKRTYPEASVSGLDGDPKMLGRARSKAARLGIEMQFSEALSDDMPYRDATFDVVTTSLMLHHLSGQGKRDTAREIHRVLKPGGQLLGLDFAEPLGWLGRQARPLTRRFERIAENLDGMLPVIFREAGFREYTELRRQVWGSIALFRACK